MMMRLLPIFLLLGFVLPAQEVKIDKYCLVKHKKELTKTTYLNNHNKPALEIFYTVGMVSGKVFYYYEDTSLVKCSQFIFTNNDSVPDWTMEYSSGRHVKTDYYYPNGSLHYELVKNYDTLNRLSDSEFFIIDQPLKKISAFRFEYTYPSTEVIICKKRFNDSIKNDNSSFGPHPMIPADTTRLHFDSQGRIILIEKKFNDPVFQWGTSQLLLKNEREYFHYDRKHFNQVRKEVSYNNEKRSYRARHKYYENGALKYSRVFLRESRVRTFFYYDEQGNVIREVNKSRGNPPSKCYFNRISLT